MTSIESSRVEIPFDENSLDLLFECLSDKEILVGGQALIYWASQYGLLEDGPVMTKDADVFAPFDSVAYLSSEMNGRAIYPPRKGFGTALHGQVEIPVNQNHFLNIDVLRTVYGVDDQAIIKKAILTPDNFFVINPIDLLYSKIINYLQINEKHNDEGLSQALLSVRVIKCFIEEMVESKEITNAIRLVTSVFDLGKSNAGRAALKCGINIFDGIYWNIPNENFQNEWRPRAQDIIYQVMEEQQESEPRPT